MKRYRRKNDFTPVELRWLQEHKAAERATLESWPPSWRFARDREQQRRELARHDEERRAFLRRNPFLRVQMRKDSKP